MIYIAWVESIKYILEIWWEESSPATIRLTNGTIAPWLRYAEWLITCPVILIALSRVGTEGGNYSIRTMKLLTSDQAGGVIENKHSTDVEQTVESARRYEHSP